MTDYLEGGAETRPCEEKTRLRIARKVDGLDFDDNRAWGPLLTAAAGDLISEPAVEQLVAAAPELIDDALGLLFSYPNRKEIIEATLVWIRSTTIAGYHGSRLTDSEVDSIRARGLVPLDAHARRTRLRRALSPHPRWGEVADQLDPTLHAYGGEMTGGRGKAGVREGQIHLTLSRSTLINYLNHYLTHGSEFDQHVAEALLDTDGKELLRRDGQARVIRVAVPGEVALNAAHPHFTVEDLLARGDVPNLLNDFLKAWSYRLAHPDFDCGPLGAGCGMVFHSIVPSDWIVDIDTLSI